MKRSGALSELDDRTNGKKVEGKRIGDFLDYLRKIGKLQTAETYYYRFKLLAQHVGVCAEELSYEHITPLTLQTCAARLKPRHANVLIAATRSYFKFLVKSAGSEEEHRRFVYLYHRICDVPYFDVKRVIRRKGLSPEKLKQVLEAIEDDYYLLASTLIHFYLGCRPAELAQPFEAKTIDFENRSEPERIIDFDNKLISIITAKTGDERVVPIDDRMIPHFEVWYEGLERVLRWERPREWLTKTLGRRRNVPFRITAKTARQTFETQMRMRVEKQWAINYWLGHSTEIPDVYTDFVEAIEDLRNILVPRHYLFEELFSEYFST